MITYTKDARFVLQKWSTWLAMAAASLFAAVQYWESLPDVVIEMAPVWLRAMMALAGLLCAMAVPVATSIQQKSIPAVGDAPRPFDSDPASEEMP